MSPSLPSIVVACCLIGLAGSSRIMAGEPEGEPDSRTASGSSEARETLALAVKAVGIEPLLDSVLPALDAEPGSGSESAAVVDPKAGSAVGPGAASRGMPEFGSSEESGARCASRAGQRRTELFATDALLARFMASLAGRSDGSWLPPVRAWYDSAPGRSIARHEAEAAELDDAAVERRFPLIADAADWPRRKALIRASLKSSGTAQFLTGLHHGLDGIVAVGRACSLDPPVLEALAQAREQARQDETFVAFFLGVDLIVPTAVVYDGLSDETLRAYHEFASSAAGVRWFQALRQALDDTLDGARESWVADRLAAAPAGSGDADSGDPAGRASREH